MASSAPKKLICTVVPADSKGAGSGRADDLASYVRARVRGRAACEDPVWVRSERRRPNQGMRLTTMLCVDSSYAPGLTASAPVVLCGLSS